jgi:hypothetical protein
MPRFKVGDNVQMSDALTSAYDGSLGLIIGVRPNEEHMALDRYLVTFGGVTVIEAWDGQLFSVERDRNQVSEHAA